MRCVPHTVHLSAVEVRSCHVIEELGDAHMKHFIHQLLSALGIMNKGEAKHARGPRSNYQEVVTASVSREADDDLAAQEDSSVEESSERSLEPEPPGQPAHDRIDKAIYNVSQ